MQGAHLRYDLRYPQAYDRFTRTEDGVDAALRGAGIGAGNPTARLALSGQGCASRGARGIA